MFDSDLAASLTVVLACFVQVVEPAFMILDRLVGETFFLVQYDFVDLVYTLLEMAACRYICTSTTGSPGLIGVG